ncbi:hypothetical protein OG21DRAFT_1525841 [Imleria badia]|nr:hypothetical protein OG21DRAFT_1525841 [Imleria badia]
MTPNKPCTHPRIGQARPRIPYAEGELGEDRNEEPRSDGAVDGMRELPTPVRVSEDDTGKRPPPPSGSKRTPAKHAAQRTPSTAPSHSKYFRPAHCARTEQRSTRRDVHYPLFMPRIVRLGRLARPHDYLMIPPTSAPNTRTHPSTILSNCATLCTLIVPQRHKHHVPPTRSHPLHVFETDHLLFEFGWERNRVRPGGDSPTVFADARSSRACEERGEEVFAYGAATAEEGG